MNVYISGKITGLELVEAKQNFAKAAELVECMGFNPVNPFNNGLSQNDSWKDHMIEDIKMLMGCDAIIMLSNWIDSKGARIEKNIADELGLIVMHESIIQNQNEDLQPIKLAIKNATGYRFEDYVKKSRKLELLYARMIFVKYCLSKKTITNKEIALLVNRNESQICRYEKTFMHENKYNRMFREIVKKVNNHLSDSVSL